MKEGGSLFDEQVYLATQVRSGNARFAFVDPDGRLKSWLAVVVRSRTGVVYAAQCEGVATAQRLVEGYLVLLGTSKHDPDGGIIDLTPFTEVFHKDGECMWNWQGRELPGERLVVLERLVEEISYWRCGLDGTDSKHQLRIDQDRIEQLAEAWIPVQTPDGAGVLLYSNCD